MDTAWSGARRGLTGRPLRLRRARRRPRASTMRILARIEPRRRLKIEARHPLKIAAADLHPRREDTREADSRQPAPLRHEDVAESLITHH